MVVMRKTYLVRDSLVLMSTGHVWTRELQGWWYSSFVYYIPRATRRVLA